MKSVGSKDANPARAGKSRKPGVPGAVTGVADPVNSVPSSEEGKAAPKESMGSHAGRHVYRVGGFRIPVKNSVRGPKSRCAGRVKDLLRRRAEAPVSTYHDPTAIEPPIRKPPVPRDRHALHGFFSSPRGLPPGRGRSEPDDDAEDLDDD